MYIIFQSNTTFIIIGGPKVGILYIVYRVTIKEIDTFSVM
jgi:hypothetical protein